jgi:hypothetical protein
LSDEPPLEVGERGSTALRTGASVLGYAAGGWHCQRCGGPVYEIRKMEAAQRTAAKNAELASKPTSEWPLSDKFYRSKCLVD